MRDENVSELYYFSPNEQMGIMRKELKRLRGELERIAAWPNKDEHGHVLSISHGLLEDIIREILE